MTTRKKSKLKLNKEQIRMAQRYEKAWHKVYYDSARWIQQSIIEDPDGRLAKDIAHEAAILAESNAEL